jgi:hypothetical protein
VATSALPDVIDALVTLSTTALPSVSVHDGIGVSGDPGDFLMIGVEDPDIEGAAFSADVEQVRADMGGGRHETGTITCCALSWNGDSTNAGQKAARDAAFASVAAVETILRTTSPTLGVSSVLKTEFGDRITVSQAQDASGASCMVIFSVAYLARI